MCSDVTALLGLSGRCACVLAGTLSSMLVGCADGYLVAVLGLFCACVLAAILSGMLVGYVAGNRVLFVCARRRAVNVTVVLGLSGHYDRALAGTLSYRLVGCAGGFLCALSRVISRHCCAWPLQPPCVCASATFSGMLVGGVARILCAFLRVRSS